MGELLVVVYVQMGIVGEQGLVGQVWCWIDCVGVGVVVGGDDWVQVYVVLQVVEVVGVIVDVQVGIVECLGYCFVGVEVGCILLGDLVQYVFVGIK